MTCAQWGTVFDTLSFGIVGMAIAKILFWLLLGYASKIYQTPVIIAGAVTCFATHHYLRMFNSRVVAFIVKSTGTGQT